MSVQVRSIFSSDRWDNHISLTMAVIVHVCLLVLGSAVLVKPVEFGVESGPSTIEVQLIASVNSGKPQAPELHAQIVPKVDGQVILPKPVEEIMPETEKPFDALKEETVNKAVQISASAGASTQMKPHYLNNPAPVYPNESRKLGQEGLVILEVNVDRKGKPASVKVKESSGHDLLDHAALRAVRQWTFAAARIGDLPVEATVSVPVRFKLESL